MRTQCTRTKKKLDNDDKLMPDHVRIAQVICILNVKRVDLQEFSDTRVPR